MSAKGKWSKVILYFVPMNVIAVSCALLLLKPAYGLPLPVSDPFARTLIAVMVIATLMCFFALPTGLTNLSRTGHRGVGLSELLLAVFPLFVTASFYFITVNRGFIDK